MDPASQQPAAHNGAWPTRAGDAVIVRTNPSNQPRSRAENPTQIRSNPVLVRSAPTCGDSHSSSDRAHSIQQIDSSFCILPSQADHEPAPSSQPPKASIRPSAPRSSDGQQGRPSATIFATPKSDRSSAPSVKI
ncbi:hypothetical protein ACLOJK_034219 [Asimina triloba]